MTTQTPARPGGHGPMHWRGDRTGGRFGGEPESTSAPLSRSSTCAFVDLLGRDGS